MDRTIERIFLAVVTLGVAAWVVYHFAPQVAAPVADTTPESQPQKTAEGPAYLVYNLPWAFSPPIGNILPERSAGLLGQPITDSIAPSGACNCGS